MDVTASVDAARERAQEHLATFGRQVQGAVTRDLPRGVNRFLASLGSHVDTLATEVAGAVEAATAPWTEDGEGERLRARFARDARLAFAPVLAYSKGWVDGGGGGSPADLATTLVNAWAEPALAAWCDRVIEDFVAAGLGRDAGDAAPVTPAARGVPGPERAPAAEAPPATAPDLDLAKLLERAAALGIRIKNVPESPSRRYLEKLNEQLEERSRKSAPPADAAAPGRLEALLAFAELLKVRVKTVPDKPSESWLQKMEEKLREVAERKGVPIPSALGGAPAEPTPAAEPRHEEGEHGTPAWAPERSTAPTGTVTGVDAAPADPEADEARRQRVETLIEKATEAGLELGRIPVTPSDDWIDATERRLETAIQKRKDERKAERKRKEAERKARIQLLTEKASRLGVDLGPVPPFPTDDWLARSAMRIQAAMLGPTDRAGGDSGRLERLKKLIADADAAGVELGEIPPDPDDEWLEWAEGEIQRQESASESAIALVSEGFDAPTGALVYEEGTVQEQVWKVEEPVTVGRGRGNTVHVRDDAGISRQHFVIWQEGGRYWLRDEGSTKGTSVAGERSQGDVQLHGDEEIVASETRFVFRLR